MKNTALSLCVFLVLCGLTSVVRAQNKRAAGRRPERGAQVERKGRPSRTSGGAKETKGKQALSDVSAEKAVPVKDSVAGKKGAMDKAAPAKAKGKAPARAQAKAKGKGHQQRLHAFEKQRLHDQAKHLERQARLARIRELVVQKGDEKMIARVDKLIAKELQVHERKRSRVQQQRRALTGPTSDPAETVNGISKGRGGGEKGIGKAGRKTKSNADEEEVEQEKEKKAEGDAGN